MWGKIPFRKSNFFERFSPPLSHILRAKFSEKTLSCVEFHPLKPPSLFKRGYYTVSGGVQFREMENKNRGETGTGIPVFFPAVLATTTDHRKRGVSHTTTNRPPSTSVSQSNSTGSIDWALPMCKRLLFNSFAAKKKEPYSATTPLRIAIIANSGVDIALFLNILFSGNSNFRAF